MALGEYVSVSSNATPRRPSSPPRNASCARTRSWSLPNSPRSTRRKACARRQPAPSPGSSPNTTPSPPTSTPSCPSTPKPSPTRGRPPGRRRWRLPSARYYPCWRSCSRPRPGAFRCASRSCWSRSDSRAGSALGSVADTEPSPSPASSSEARWVWASPTSSDTSSARRRAQLLPAHLPGHLRQRAGRPHRGAGARSAADQPAGHHQRWGAAAPGRPPPRGSGLRLPGAGVLQRVRGDPVGVTVQAPQAARQQRLVPPRTRRRRRNPVAAGQRSDSVLLTTLANFVQPVIRYELGDSIVLDADPCPCGSALPTIRVEGRTDEILRVPRTGGGAAVLLPMAVATVVEETRGVRRYQADAGRRGGDARAGPGTPAAEPAQRKAAPRAGPAAAACAPRSPPRSSLPAHVRPSALLVRCPGTLPG